MVTPEDIADRLGQPRPNSGSPQFLQWQGFIDDAYRLISRYQTANDLDAPDPDDLDYVVREAVAALALRPDGASSVDLSIDDGRVSRMYKQDGSAHLDLSSWWSVLWPGSAAGGGAFTIRPHYEPVVYW